MKKTQIILAAIGGLTVVGALVLGYFILDASSVKSERSEELDTAFSKVQGLMRKLPVKPVESELGVYRTNAAAFVTWRTDAAKLVAAGDRVFEKTTPAELKTTIVAEARRLAALPGCLDGKLVKGDFSFGFKDYVTGGALPPSDPAALRRLQRQWDDVAHILKTIATCGGSEVGLTDVRLGAQAAKEEAAAEEDAKASSKSKRKAKARSKAKARAKVEAEGDGEGEAAKGGPFVTAFTVDFMVRPSGLVKALNAFATSERFIVVESCSFVRERDELAERLGGDGSKKASESSGSSGRRRRRGQQESEAAEASAKGGVLTDPATAPLLKATLAFSVYDFGTLED